MRASAFSVSTFVLSTVAAVLVACGGGDDGDANGDTAQTGDQPARTADLLLSFPEGPAWIGLPVARELGYLEEERLELTTEGTDGSDFVIQQVIAGNTSFGMAAATSILIGAQRDSSLRAVFCNTTRNIFGISVPEGSEIQDLGQLEGLTVGISEQGGGETPLVEAALLDAGLTAGEDVELLAIGGAGPASQRAIERGQVDAYASSFTDIIALQAAGVGLVDITPEQYTGVPGDCLAVKEETLDDPEQRDAIIRLARAWSKGSLFAASNPDRAFEIGCDRFPEDCTDRRFAREYMNNRVELITPIGEDPGETEIPYGLPQPEGWETALDLLVTSDQLDQPPAVEDIIGTDSVSEIIEEWSDYDVEEVRAQAQEQ